MLARQWCRWPTVLAGLQSTTSRCVSTVVTRSISYPVSKAINVNNLTFTGMLTSIIRLRASLISKSCCRTLASKGSSATRRVSKGNQKGSGKHASSLSDEEVSEVINVEALKSNLDRCVAKLKDDFIRLSLRTSVGSIELLAVTFEGHKYLLNEIAQVVRKNPGLVVLNMGTAPSAIPSVLEAIANSGFNLNPQQDGTTIALPLPQVTREHREALAKNAKALFNRAKEELKDVQNRYIKAIKDKKGIISDDLIFSVQQYVIALTDSNISNCDAILQKKQSELTG